MLNNSVAAEVGWSIKPGFSEKFWPRYQEGETPRKIVEELGYDPDMLGTARLSGLQMNIKKHTKARRFCRRERKKEEPQS